MAADIPFMEVTGRKDVQNGGRSILKMTTGFGLFSTLSKVKIYFFLLFTSNLSYFNSFKLPYKIRLLGFRSPLKSPTSLQRLNFLDNNLFSYSEKTLPSFRSNILCCKLILIYYIKFNLLTCFLIKLFVVVFVIRLLTQKTFHLRICNRTGPRAIKD